MKFVSDLLTVLIQLGILGIIIAILLKLYPNFLPRPAVRRFEPVTRDEGRGTSEDADADPENTKDPKPFWDDVNQLEMAVDAGVTDFRDNLPVNLRDLGPLDQQREIADRILELKDRQK